MMSRKMLDPVGPLARPYSVGPMLPRAPVPSFCSTIARIPASDGATNDVPPKTLARPLAERKPLVHDPWLQTTYPSCSAAALSETSGTSREESLGTPMPTCHAGLEKKPLAPPPVLPPSSSPPETVVSFHGCSEIRGVAVPRKELVTDPTLGILVVPFV